MEATMRSKGFMTYATALIGADADPEVGHHHGETDHHDDDQHILGSVTHP